MNIEVSKLYQIIGELLVAKFMLEQQVFALQEQLKKAGAAENGKVVELHAAGS